MQLKMMLLRYKRIITLKRGGGGGQSKSATSVLGAALLPGACNPLKIPGVGGPILSCVGVNCVLLEGNPSTFS